MSLEEMVRAKNVAILELRSMLAQDDRSRILAVATRAAELEEQIAEYYLARGKHEDAVVNLISQASCLRDADDLSGAMGVLQRAKSLTKTKSVSKWIDEQLSEIPRRTARTSQSQAASPSFSHTRTKIRGSITN
jgi:hypothetical protein